MASVGPQLAHVEVAAQTDPAPTPSKLQVVNVAVERHLLPLDEKAVVRVGKFSSDVGPVAVGPVGVMVTVENVDCVEDVEVVDDALVDDDVVDEVELLVDLLQLGKFGSADSGRSRSTIGQDYMKVRRTIPLEHGSLNDLLVHCLLCRHRWGRDR